MFIGCLERLFQGGGAGGLWHKAGMWSPDGGERQSRRKHAQLQPFPILAPRALPPQLQCHTIIVQGSRPHRPRALRGCKPMHVPTLPLAQSRPSVPATQQRGALEDGLRVALPGLLHRGLILHTARTSCPLEANSRMSQLLQLQIQSPPDTHICTHTPAWKCKSHLGGQWHSKSFTCVGLERTD